MKTIIAATALLSLIVAPYRVCVLVCHSDNVPHALWNNAPSSTHSQPPPNQPLLTYVSQYPAPRVSSGCNCLVTPTVLSNPCQRSGNIIKEGGFQTLKGGNVSPWKFALQVSPNSGQGSSASLVHARGGNNSSKVENSLGGGYGETYIGHSIPTLYKGARYTLTYDSQITINGDGTGLTCTLEIYLHGQLLLFLAYESSSYTFTYSETASAQALTSGFFIVDNVSLVGLG